MISPHACRCVNTLIAGRSWQGGVHGTFWVYHFSPAFGSCALMHISASPSRSFRGCVFPGCTTAIVCTIAGSLGAYWHQLVHTDTQMPLDICLKITIGVELEHCKTCSVIAALDTCETSFQVVVVLLLGAEEDILCSFLYRRPVHKVEIDSWITTYNFLYNGNATMGMTALWVKAVKNFAHESVASFSLAMDVFSAFYSRKQRWQNSLHSWQSYFFSNHTQTASALFLILGIQ